MYFIIVGTDTRGDANRCLIQQYPLGKTKANIHVTCVYIERQHKYLPVDLVHQVVLGYRGLQFHLSHLWYPPHPVCLWVLSLQSGQVLPVNPTRAQIQNCHSKNIFGTIMKLNTPKNCQALIFVIIIVAVYQEFHFFCQIHSLTQTNKITWSRNKPSR